MALPSIDWACKWSVLTMKETNTPVESATTENQTGAWSMDRQVRITAGLLVLFGIALAYTVNATWICLSAFVALGMIVSAVTNTCGMSVFLARMPWNKSGHAHERCAH